MRGKQIEKNDDEKAKINGIPKFTWTFDYKMKYS